jgi:hypothetical protein
VVRRPDGEHIVLRDPEAPDRSVNHAGPGDVGPFRQRLRAGEDRWMASVHIPSGLSASDAELYEHLVTHAERENSMMERYQAIAGSREGYVGFLSGLIAEDEERHHRLYEVWARALSAAAELKVDPVTAVRREPDPDELLAAVEALLDFEKQDADQLKAMGKGLHDSRDTEIWSLVLDVMRADTQKHIRILTFIRDHLRASHR